MNPAASSRPHLTSALLALLCAAVIVGAGLLYARSLEHRCIRLIASEPGGQKNSGSVLQIEALNQPDILPCYGSSELEKYHAGENRFFFVSEPTGFQVGAVGKAGLTPLNLLHKFGALGGALQGRKVVILLSPSWFLRLSVHEQFYNRCFSYPQAHASIFSNRLSYNLKRDIAIPLVAHTDEKLFDDHEVFAFACEQLASGTTLGHLFYDLSVPVGRLEDATLTMHDHFAAAGYLLKQHLGQKSWQSQPRTLNWPQLVSEAEARTVATGDYTNRADKEFVDIEQGGDPVFLNILAHAGEWENLKLVLRTLKELGARPLVISMPLNGPYLDRIGISPAARSAYYAKLHALVDEQGFALMDFHEFEEDPKFLADHHDHPTAKGWMVFNAVFDAFYHDDLPEISSLLQTACHSSPSKPGIGAPLKSPHLHKHSPLESPGKSGGRGSMHG